jgi:hypothetical protein
MLAKMMRIQLTIAEVAVLVLETMAITEFIHTS